MCCFYEAKTIRIDNRSVPKEPAESVDIAAIRKNYPGTTCPVCNSFGRLQYASCVAGEVALLGGVQQCSRCFGSGLKPCFVCETRGVLKGQTSKPFMVAQ